MSILVSAISEQRLWQRHEAMAAHGATPRGGVNRQALSQADIDARRTICSWARELGLGTFTDALGNFFIRLEGSDPSLPPVLTGSHLDSQPTGGRLDGVYGVLAGFEVLQTLVESGLRPRRSIEVVSWMNEEGSRFAPGMMGSAGFAGTRNLVEILPVRDVDGVSVAEAVAEVHRQMPEVALRPLGYTPHCYVEAHIEQGPVLEAQRQAIGIVTGIQGKRTFRVTVTGEEAHAGTTPHQDRKDALMSASAMLQALKVRFLDPQDITRFTVGLFRIEPCAPSVVPARAVFSIDIRHPLSERLTELGDAVAPLCHQYAAPCAVQVEELSTALSLEFPESIRQTIEQAAAELGLGHMRLLSAAGHDARYLHEQCETGMIFVPCLKGVSHHESESATSADLAAGARVLGEVLWARAR